MLRQGWGWVLVLAAAGCTAADGAPGGDTDADTSSADATGQTTPGGADAGDSSGAGDDGVESADAGETGDQPQLQVEVDGAGRVLVDPPGEVCTASCTYDAAGTVMLTAMPDAGSSFVEWLGDCAGGDATTELSVSEAHACTAVFDSLPEGDIDASMTASREVARVPAEDAPASDSESVLEMVSDVALEVTWTIHGADDGQVVATGQGASSTFSCPEGRRDYDVAATVSDGRVQARFFERRLVTCVPPRSDAGRTVHSVNLAEQSYFQQGMIDGVQVQPGDLIRVSGELSGALAFFNFQGQPEAPIHIINDGPVRNTDASWLLHLINCQHVIVDGLGDDAVPYGFSLSNAGDGAQAVFIRNYTQGENISTGSTDIELFGIEMDGIPDSGFRVSTEGSDAFNRDNWTFENLRLHHNHVRRAETEAFYIGYYTDSSDIQPPPFAITDAKIYRNLVEDSGWDGMQFGGCVEGLEVHHNVVTGSALLDVQNQRSSLQYNPGNGGAVYNNVFVGGRGVDLQVGCTGGDSFFFSNVFANDHAGFYLHGGASDSPAYTLFANTVRSPAEVGMRVNMNGAPNCAAPGDPVSSVSYAANLSIGGAAEAVEFVVGDPGEDWVLEPNLAWTGEAAELCLDDLTAAPSCERSAALAGDGLSFDALGIDPAQLPGGRFTDAGGRVRDAPLNYGAHQGR
ncbi:MAG: hypothetical protein AAGA54_27560 [Myxococcota bacterium]